MHHSASRGSASRGSASRGRRASSATAEEGDEFESGSEYESGSDYETTSEVGTARSAAHSHVKMNWAMFDKQTSPTNKN